MNCTIIILGATGDLTKKKLIPSIYNLIQNKKLDKCVVVGVSFDKVNTEVLLNRSKKYIKFFNQKTWNKLKKSFYYHQTDFYDKKKFCELGPFVRNIERKHKLSGNRLFYLATLPQHFKAVADTIHECRLEAQDGNWTRIGVEKPFGHNLK